MPQSWSGQLYLGEAQQLVCLAVSINEAAGGAATFSSQADYISSIQAIGCNFAAANAVLGSSAHCGGIDSIPNALAYVALQAREMAINTGGTPDFPFDPYDLLSVWQAIGCYTRQVSTNTGHTAVGGGADNVLNCMEQVYCNMTQIVANGFGGGGNFVVTSPAGDQVVTSPAGDKVLVS